MSVSRDTVGEVAIPQRFMVAGAFAATLGIGLSAIGQAAIGSIASVVGMALLIGGVHTFGRSGADTGGMKK